MFISIPILIIIVLLVWWLHGSNVERAYLAGAASREGDQERREREQRALDARLEREYEEARKQRAAQADRELEARLASERAAGRTIQSKEHLALADAEAQFLAEQAKLSSPDEVDALRRRWAPRLQTLQNAAARAEHHAQEQAAQERRFAAMTSGELQKELARCKAELRSAQKLPAVSLERLRGVSRAQAEIAAVEAALKARG
jgi:hypothetical protein